MRTIIRTIASMFILSLFSINVLALPLVSNHLEEAMKHTEAAISSFSEDGIIQHATMAITHANAAKKHDKQVNARLLDEGVMSLDDAIKEIKNGSIKAAHNEARKAFQHFKAAKPFTIS